MVLSSSVLINNSFQIPGGSRQRSNRILSWPCVVLPSLSVPANQIQRVRFYDIVGKDKPTSRTVPLSCGSGFRS